MLRHSADYAERLHNRVWDVDGRHMVSSSRDVDRWHMDIGGGNLDIADHRGKSNRAN